MTQVEKLQIENLIEEEKQKSIDLFGPFKQLIKLTGLDCSAVDEYSQGKGSKCAANFTKFFAIFIIFSLIFRTLQYFSIDSSPMSLLWAESNAFAFMGIHSVVCAFCLFGWTKNGFFRKHLERLEHARTYRVKINESLDDYRKYRTLCLIWPTIYFAVIMSHIVYCALLKQITVKVNEENTSTSLIYLIMPILTFIVWMIVSLTLIVYNLATLSINRELEYFNEELINASENKKLIDFEILSHFCNRQAAILKMVKESNVSLGSCAKFAPLFCLFSVINAIYVTSFGSDLSTFTFVILLFNMFVIIGMVVTTLVPAGKVQDNIRNTATILMLDDGFESAENQEIYQTYRIMVDRSIKLDSRMYLLNGFPIDTSTFNMAMLIVPNLGSVLVIIKKVLIFNGFKV